MYKKSILLCACGIFLSFAPSAFAGIIAGDFNNQSTLSKYVNFSSQQNFPYVGGLLIEQGKKQSICSGTLIHKQWVLTAAHCVYNRPGDTKTSAKFILSNGLFEANVVSAVTHKSWKKLVDSGTVNLDLPQTALNDIALLKLDKDATLFGVKLPKPSTTVLGPLDKFVGLFVGAGKKGDGDKGLILAANPFVNTGGFILGGQNRVNILSNGAFSYDLDKSNSAQVTNIDFLPAVDLEFMPTSGDSGSPIILGSELVGIHSRSKGGVRCLANSGSCFSHEKAKYGTLGFANPVAKYAGWIANTIKNYPKSTPVRTRPSKSIKISFTAGGYQYPSWDVADVEVNDSYLPLVFDLVEDRFSDEFNQSVFNSVFETKSPNTISLNTYYK